MDSTSWWSSFRRARKAVFLISVAVCLAWSALCAVYLSRGWRSYDKVQRAIIVGLLSVHGFSALFLYLMTVAGFHAVLDAIRTLFLFVLEGAVTTMFLLHSPRFPCVNFGSEANCRRMTTVILVGCCILSGVYVGYTVCLSVMICACRSSPKPLPCPLSPVLPMQMPKSTHKLSQPMVRTFGQPFPSPRLTVRGSPIDLVGAFPIMRGEKERNREGFPMYSEGYTQAPSVYSVRTIVPTPPSFSKESSRAIEPVATNAIQKQSTIVRKPPPIWPVPLTTTLEKTATKLAVPDVPKSGSSRYSFMTYYARTSEGHGSDSADRQTAVKLAPPHHSPGSLTLPPLSSPAHSTSPWTYPTQFVTMANLDAHSTIPHSVDASPTTPKVIQSGTLLAPDMPRTPLPTPWPVGLPARPKTGLYSPLPATDVDFDGMLFEGTKSASQSHKSMSRDTST